MKILTALLLAIAAAPVFAKDPARACVVTDIRAARDRPAGVYVIMTCEGGRFGGAVLDTGGIARGTIACRRPAECPEEMALLKSAPAQKGEIYLCEDSQTAPREWLCALEASR